MTEIERLKEKLISLRLKVMAQELDAILQDANKKNTDFLSILERLADLETEHRRQNAIKLRFQQSRLNEKTTIDQFDFNHHKSRKDQKTQILNLFNLEFVREYKDVILIGNPGTGKTFLTTNLPFAEWGNVFDSTTVATAIADRLVHNSEVLIMGGTSYRRKQK